ncbi:MAG: hypothetical protein L0Y66_11870 [Myxococcaceae bacterium]|nr:hypothetical protein [Myxococcaceae bacterium]MCI0672619.1 hypothetical protein [Myxococcaceae bacterium]
MAARTTRTVERVQTGVRMERRILLVLKALAASKGMTLGDLLEGIVLHAFEGKAPFKKETLEQVEGLKKAFGLELTASDSHGLVEAAPTRAPAKKRRER